MTLGYEGVGQIECGVTQDKSACVRPATFTNGGGALRRVRPKTGASRRIGQTIGERCNFERVGFVQTVYDKWFALSPLFNGDGQSSTAMWCM